MYNLHTHCLAFHYTEWIDELPDDGDAGFFRGLLYDLLRTYVRDNVDSQLTVFEHLMARYPPGTRFGILPMDFSGVFPNVADLEFPQLPRLNEIQTELNDLLDFSRQLAGLNEIKAKYPEIAFPFGFADPRARSMLADLEQAIDTYGFYGCKIYPKLGYAPNDERLYPAYELLADRGKPVISHGARGGAPGKFELGRYFYIKKYYQAQVPTRLKWRPMAREVKLAHCNDPRNFKPILEKYPTLRIALAHLAGDNRKYHLTADRLAALDAEPALPAEIKAALQVFPDTTYFKTAEFDSAVKASIGATAYDDHGDLIRDHARAALTLADCEQLYAARQGDITDNWTAIALQMAREYEHFYIDCSCTFHETGKPLVKEMLADEDLKGKILFGSDWYMNTTFGAGEAEYQPADMEAYFGADGFRQMAEINAEKFLFGRDP